MHVVYSFAVGGLENVVVQLVNGLPRDRFRHSILALTRITALRDRVTHDDVQYIGLEKKPGHAVPLYPTVWRQLRKWSPDVVHTCNMAPLELVPIAWSAGVPLRVHAEHGWSPDDLDGSNARNILIRRLYRPFVSRYVAVSAQIDRYLARRVGVPARRRVLIPNGVDTTRFTPRCPSDPPACSPLPFDAQRHVVFGTVGRMQDVKNQPLMATALTRLIRRRPELRLKVRAAFIGDGPLRQEVESILAQDGCGELAWFPGVRDDVAALLPWLDVFVLPSRTEGTSCTLQEAMASGLPSIVTDVGGNAALVAGGVHGWLVPSDDAEAMSRAMEQAIDAPASRDACGRAARRRALQDFSGAKMLEAYAAVFDPKGAPLDALAAG